MINDKKIEEAARYYCNNRYPASQDAPFIAEGFRLGAKWAVNELLKDLWHPASEEPRKDVSIIVETHNDKNMFYSNMKKYIGTKVVNATPAWRVDGKVYLKDDAVPKSMNREDGYKVVYEDGYESWSPKDVFEKAYREVGSVNFGGAIDLLKAGLAVRRKGWNGKGLFIVKHVPSHITSDIIPNMQSLPQSAKSILMSRENPHIDYTNQMLIINPDGRADSWVPSVSDVFEEDWEVVTE
jgi:hypothetical protein|nr:MAG TPA: Protein of unknown function (DUF2829) [Caudoviricetes sp.]